ncbi:DUF4238 domain-containing protein [Sinorhizobium meliloti]|uniref:DUF4238 domain-containing protein n=1 Tax=Rhizobium meliloti TaxID=382 RepID=UPI000FD974F0|nr:DUF4238 domain-containing protein [Sinorhizobium meliloti]RVG87502.1 DUF4238 domain-containing protein [Sinorhizobium meliloti]
MNRSIPKRHHFVPEMLQKRFVNEQGGLWTYDSRRADSGVRADMPGNLFLEGHLYTHVGKDGAKDVSLEQDFSRLEGLADPLISKMIDATTKNRVPLLTADERVIWDEFFLQQWRRVPDLRDELMSVDAYRRAIEEAINDFSNSIRPVSSVVRDKYLAPDKVKRGRNNLHVNTLKSQSTKIRNALAGRGLLFARVRNPRKSLILSSRPVVKVTSGAVKLLSDERVHAWLAISPSLAVSPGYYGAGTATIDLTDDQVRLMNLAFAEQSSQIAGKSEALVKSLSPYVGKAMDISRPRR